MAATSHVPGLTRDVSALGAALFGDCVEPFAEISDITREIIQPWQLRKRLEPEDALEHRRRAVLDRAADAVVPARLRDQPALDKSRHGGVGCDAADPRD